MDNVQKNLYFDKYNYLIIIDFKFLSRVSNIWNNEKNRDRLLLKKKKKNIRQRNGIFWWRAMVCRRETSRYRAEKAWIVAFVIDTWTHQCFHCNFLLLLWSTRFQVTVDSCFEFWHRSSHVQEYFHNTGKTMHRDRLIFATLLIVYPKLDVCR